MNTNKNEEELWWLSFVDAQLPKGEQFLGVIILRGQGFTDAIRRTHALKLNPGGGVQGLKIPEEIKIDDIWLNRLLPRNECEQLDREIASREEENATLSAAPE